MGFVCHRRVAASWESLAEWRHINSRRSSVDQLCGDQGEDQDRGGEHASGDDEQAGVQRAGLGLEKADDGGLKKPPRLPVQLTSAMPAAAAAPPRKDVGSAQNMGTEVTTPTTARFMPIAASDGLLAP